MQRGVHFDPLRLPLLGGCELSSEREARVPPYTPYGSTHCLRSPGQVGTEGCAQHSNTPNTRRRGSHCRCCALSARGLGCADDGYGECYTAWRCGLWCGGLVRRRRGSVCCVLSSPRIHAVVDGARYTEAVERSPPWYGMPWCVDFSFSPKSRLRLKVELPAVQCS